MPRNRPQRPIELCPRCGEYGLLTYLGWCDGCTATALNGKLKVKRKPHCVVCGEVLLGRRQDMRFCSKPDCQRAHHRYRAHKRRGADTALALALTLGDRGAPVCVVCGAPVRLRITRVMSVRFCRSQTCREVRNRARASIARGLPESAAMVKALAPLRRPADVV